MRTIFSILLLSLIVSNHTYGKTEGTHLGKQHATKEDVDYKVGDKVRTIPEYTDGSSGRYIGKYFEGYVLNIFETPDNTWVEKGHTIFLAVVDSGGSVYCSGIRVMNVYWFRKFNEEIDPPSYFWAADEYFKTGVLPKPRKEVK